jgi:DNA ligase 1
MNVMLAKTYDGQNVDGWFMSEKLDGVRAVWTGSELLSRNGNRFAAPEWFIAQLPRGVVLDGELFGGRGRFQATVAAVRRKTPADAEWRAIRYCVFDAPAAEGTFKARLAFCVAALAGCAVAEVVAHQACESKAHLDRFAAALCANGAEGVMLRDPASRYEACRSSKLLKHKAYDSDEAVVVGHEPGEGKYVGLVGSLAVRWGGVEFHVGTGLTDDLRREPPAVGSRVTFGYCGLTDGGVPRFPTYVDVRNYE